MERSRLIVEKSEVAVDNGCVVAQHPIAAEVGAEVLAQGGNAVDAAVATAFALGVVEPMMSGPGGGGDILVHLARDDSDRAIDFLPHPPAAVRPDMFELDRGRGTVGMYGWPAVKADANTSGYRAVAVPGAVAGLCRALEKWGTWPLRKVIEPAVALAEEGFVADWYISAMITAGARRMRHFEEIARVFLPGGLPPEARTRTYVAVEPLRQLDLAHTLKRIAEHGPDEFYRGETARLMVRAMEHHGGLITAQDLAAYRPVEYEHLAAQRYRDVTMLTVPTPCGATTTFEALNIIEGFDLRAAGFHSARALHLLAEAQRLAFQDRFAHLADPAAVAVPLEGLLSREYAAHRRAAIDPRRARPHIGPGEPWTFQQAKHPAAQARIPRGEGGCTTHLCVIDRDRNMVSLTNTLLDVWGSMVMPAGTGIVLNDGMGWYDPEPGHLNSIAPGKRPLSAGAMMLVRRGGRPFMALGAPGGRKIITAVMQVLINVVDYGMGMQAAIAAPRMHAEAQTVSLDARLTAVGAQLAAMGHNVDLQEETYLSVNFARPVGIMIDPADGKLRAGVDVLRPATAVGL